MTPVRIRYERLSSNAKGATSFIGMVYMDDGSKIPVDGYTGSEDLTTLPVEHEAGNSTAVENPRISFPKIKP